MFDFGIGTGTAILGSTILSSVMGALGSNEQADSAQSGIDAQMDIYNNNMSLLSPYYQAGYKALPSLEDAAYGGKASSLYRFQQNEGTSALNKQLAARGLYNSGAGLDLHRKFNESLAASEADKMYGRQYNLANLGYGALNAGVASGQNAAQNLMQGYTNQGNANASMYTGFGNSLLGGMNSYLNFMGGQSGSTTPSLAQNIAKADSYFGYGW